MLLNLRSILENFSANGLVTQHLLLSTWSLLCDGRHRADVVVSFHFPVGLRVHSVEGVYRGPAPCDMVVVSVQVTDKNLHTRENFRFLGIGFPWVFEEPFSTHFSSHNFFPL